ncbi:glycoside hydrolase family 5 protein [Streptomyces sp. NBC_01381]|uniref:glycoside hydrolase family 5 protein n=1 Tax=Streptomyces sp. NBC_01381 TaxID=2903845 RepID=UPI00225A1B2B|nr:cellulase family glycosylhydrolase [Streptomyces sp. NBC_01381]MCX4671909.1 glycoside hydrolase family 5 protein [Streptomyces sp. NBC_01381]
MSPHITSQPSTPPPARRRRLRRPQRRALAALLPVLVAVPIAVVSGASSATAEPSELDPSQFKGVNWARPGDNFVDAPAVPEGLDVADSYDTVKAKADSVYTGFESIGVNTVRLPVNTKSVGTPWWDAYTGAIDAATAKGFKVVLSYWEDGASSNGRIIDMAAFNSMWNTVAERYGSDDHVYFEPMNEPRGYSATEWADIAATWIADRPAIPKERIFVSGSGYNDEVKSVCADSRLDGTYLSLHHYAFGKDPKDYDGWVADLKNGLGDCASRTVLDEFGAPMDDEPDTGFDYNDPDSGENFVRYLRADTDTVRSLGMGAIYWPALGGKHQERPMYDYYSLFALEGSGTDLRLTPRNPSGIDRLKHAWGLDAG